MRCGNALQGHHLSIPLAHRRSSGHQQDLSAGAVQGADSNDVHSGSLDLHTGFKSTY